MSQNTHTCTDKAKVMNDETLRVSLAFRKIIEAEVSAGNVPASAANFELNEAGEYSYVPTQLLWHFFQLGYATRMAKAVELPKEVNGALIEHMPKGSGFKSGFDYLVKDLLAKGVNLV